jgi:hypothetical protein
MEILGSVEFNGVVYFPSYVIESGSNLRMNEILILCYLFYIFYPASLKFIFL